MRSWPVSNQPPSNGEWSPRAATIKVMVNSYIENLSKVQLKGSANESARRAAGAW
jgi:hypothetical protein